MLSDLSVRFYSEFKDTYGNGYDYVELCSRLLE